MFLVVLRRHRRSVRMRMIKADYIQMLGSGVPFSAEQFFRANQKAIALGSFLPRVRNAIGFRDNLAPVFKKSPYQQTAALVRIVSLAMSAHRVQVSCADSDHRPASSQ